MLLYQNPCLVLIDMKIRVLNYWSKGIAVSSPVLLQNSCLLLAGMGTGVLRHLASKKLTPMWHSESWKLLTVLLGKYKKWCTINIILGLIMQAYSLRSLCEICAGNFNHIVVAEFQLFTVVQVRASLWTTPLSVLGTRRTRQLRTW